MLKLQGITKEYPLVNDEKVLALKGIDLEFRRREFVSILGHSGCGKTTLLNIIGGLDRYTDGELFINGISTKQYKDKEWDAYRNHSIGFIFQTYNLIMHLTVLENVELALTLVGIDRKERHERAKKALASVGLKGQENKRPNQLSGGQMQRVAIARAIINDPEILLADEPTGALDTDTSVQIMEILKSLSKDRLIIMVTHNPDLAYQYSSRIVRLLDGEVVDDSNPYDSEKEPEGELKAEVQDEAPQETPEEGKRSRRKSKRTGKGRDHTSMSYKSALALSGKNLLTKRARTLLTSIAGSIGIIGIAVVMALSSGFGGFVARTAENTLSSYPLTVAGSEMNLSSLMGVFMDLIVGAGGGKTEYPKDDKVELNAIISTLLSPDKFSSLFAHNDLEALKVYLDQNFDTKWGTVKYNYDLDMHLYTNYTESTNPATGEKERFYYKINPFYARVADQLQGVLNQGESLQGVLQGLPIDDLLGQVETYSQMFAVWDELTTDQTLLENQYDLLGGSWPSDPTEMVLVVDKYNSIGDMMAFALGLLNPNDAADVVLSALGGNNPLDDWSVTTQVIIDTLQYQLMLESNYFVYNEEMGGWEMVPYIRLANDSTEAIKNLVDPDRETCVATTLKVSGVVRLKEGVSSGAINGVIAYRHDLIEWMINAAATSDIVTAQRAVKETVYTNKNLSTIDYVQYRLAGPDRGMPWADTLGSKVIAVEQYDHGAPTGEVTILGEDADEIAYNTMWYNRLKNGGTGAERKMYPATSSIDGSTYLAVEKDGGRDKVTYNRLATGCDDAKYEKRNGISYTQYEEWMTELGYLDLNTPSSISIYSSNFDNKEAVIALLDAFASWEGVDADGNEVKGSALQYSDTIGMLMSSITIIIQAITYVLIAFSAISLIVSSIMIAIITYTSVMERTKEIGVLRSIGARKKDITRVYNSETFIIGLMSGIIAVLVAWILTFPANAILLHYTSIKGLVRIEWWQPLLLIGLSVVLTGIAGFIPSRIASNKDPVAALRSE